MYKDKYEYSINNLNDFWKKEKDIVTWKKDPNIITSGDFENVNFKWFEDGEINISYNCIDRHIENGNGDKIAIIWAKDEVGEYEYISYSKLHKEVSKVANSLKNIGAKKGDKVCLYMPMIPEAVYTMLASTRLGLVHNVVFGGFSSNALKERIASSDSKFVFTANYGVRGGKKIPLKNIVDEAIENIDCVENVIYVNRTDDEINHNQIDILWNDFIKNSSDSHNPEFFSSETENFILYTSGSTGKPKGLLHTTGGYITYASYTHKTAFDIKPDDIYFCTADIGWITGHSYVVYGPLSNGVTTVLFESVPTYPDAGRYWKIIEDLGVNVFYTAPTALRSLASFGDEYVEKYNLSSLRVLGTVGEPINPEIWDWYNNVVGKNNCSIIDTWWQTETGGFMIAPIANTTSLYKAGSATKPLYGINPVLLDIETGVELKQKNETGALCFKHSWPGQARTIYGDHERFKEVYFNQYKGMYFSGDGAMIDDDGDFWIEGRIDDVINVSGHRFGTAEIEAAIMEVESVTEVAVIGKKDGIKGESIFAFVISNQEEGILSDEIINQVDKSIGKIARPSNILIVDDLPKTRSGKVMRRILKKISDNKETEIGDVSTLSNPECVEKIIQLYKKLSNYIKNNYI